MTDKTDFIMVLTTVPDKTTGQKIARALVEKRNAACASLSSACESTYWWKGRVQQETEYMLHIKTTARLYSAVEQKIIDIHPYELPEIIAFPITKGSVPYLEWIESETLGD